MLLTGETKQWHKLTIEFNGPDMGETPDTFLNHRLDVTFTHADGTTIEVPGYFAADGDAANSGANSGSVWRVHFNPPETGEWSWEASFRTGNDIAISDETGASAGFFDGNSGTFSVTETDKSGLDLRGKGMLEYNGDQYMNFAETGEIFLKSGVGSPENFLAYSGFDATPGTHDYTPHLNDFDAGDPTWGNGQGEGIIGAVNYLADNGVNSAYMMLMNIGGDGRDVSPWADQSLYNIRKDPGSIDLDERAQVFDVSKLDQWEIVFEHMQEKGVNLHLFLQETENDQLLNGGDLGPERMLFMREMVARFGHHNGLTWNLGEENTNTTGQIIDHSNYLKAIDPYDHAVALHTYPGEHNKYEAYEGTDTLDVLSFQTGGDTQVPDLDRYLGGAEDAGRPVVAFLDEPGNARTGLAAEGDNGWQQNHANMRETLWKFYAEGGSGAEWYFGYQTAGGEGGDLRLEDFSSRESAYEWAASAREFFEKLPLESMQDGDGLTSGAQTFGLAQTGEIYAYYLPNGGSPTLDLSGQPGTYNVGWYDVINGGDFVEGTVDSVNGGGVRSLGSAPSQTGSEWALVVWNTNSYDFPVVQSSADAPDSTVDAPPTPPDASDSPGDTPAPDTPTDAGSAEGPVVTLRIVDTTTDETIARFGAGDTLDGGLIGADNISIVADVSEPVGSVRLTLGNHSAVENVAPYALFGDIGGDFNAPGRAPFGTAQDYTVRVELFENANAQGRITETSTRFAVSQSSDDSAGDDGDTTPPPPPPSSDASTPSSDATWVAQNGTVVMEAENGVISDPNDSSNGFWALKDSLNGHTGEGYLHWEGPNYYNQPGEGALSYDFEVGEGGVYKFGLSGSRPNNGEASDLNNDFFVRMDGGPWQKVFFTGARETWNWGRTFDVNHNKSSAEYNLEPGTHTLEISGRSENAYIDRIHLSLGNLNTDKSLPETLASAQNDDDPSADVPNSAPVVVAQDFTTMEDEQLVISANQIATDPDNDTVSLSITSQPGNGTLSLSNGQLVYTPNADFSGTDSASVQVSDGEGGDTAVTLDFTVNPVNDAPNAVDDTAGEVTAGEAFVLDDVLLNDSDPDGDDLSVSEVSAATAGFFDTLEIDADGRISGTLAADADGTGTINYTVSDGNGGTDTASISVAAVTPDVPDAPDNTDTLDDSTVPDAPDNTDTPDNSDLPDASDNTDTPDNSDLPDASDSPGDTPAPDTPREDDGSVLSLVDTETDEILVMLGDRTVIHEGLIADRNISVSAEVDEDKIDAESAKMSLNGAYVRTENVEPYALFGDIERDYMGDLDISGNEEVAISVEYFDQDRGKGTSIGEDHIFLKLGGSTMSGVSNVMDAFAFDSTMLGAATISGFETGDQLQMLNGPDSAELLAGGVQQGDDLFIDFGDGNSLLLEDYAAAQMAKEQAEEDPEDLLVV